MDAWRAAAGILVIYTAVPALVQAQSSKRYDIVDVLWIVGGLVIAVVVLAGIVMMVRNRAFAKDGPSTMGSAGLMDNLRALRDKGTISEAEYQETRAKLAGRLRASAGGRGEAGASMAVNTARAGANTQPERPAETQPRPTQQSPRTTQQTPRPAGQPLPTSGQPHPPAGQPGQPTRPRPQPPRPPEHP